MEHPRPHICIAALGFIATIFPSMGYDSDWELIFNDEFADTSFTDGVLNWDEKWNKTDYLNVAVPDWRKYQSRDDALVTQGVAGDTDYVTLKGAYGDYTSQSDQTGSADTFACGGIFTYTTLAFQYGYVEARARFDSAQGAWPAIWLMPTPATSQGWPTSGEIDLMEHVNYENRIHQTLHLYNSARTADAAPSHVTGITNTNDWHTYGVEWNPEQISFYIDGVHTGSFYAKDFVNWPFADESLEFYLLIDQQLGGSWTGAPNATALSEDSADFDIDYVRVYSTRDPSGSTHTTTAAWSQEMQAPVDTEGALINYTDVADKTSGILDQPTPGHYRYAIEGSISHLLAEGSHVELHTANGDTSINLGSTMIQADSLYISEGKYVLSGSATLDVDTLFVVGGSLEISSEYALRGIKHLYLGMESDIHTSFAARNATLYMTDNHKIAADVTLVNDSKLAVYQGKTLEISGNLQGENHTLNLVGVNSAGTATIVLSGQSNKVNTLSMGIAGTTIAGNTFNGAGQILELRLAAGAHTEVEHLQTASPVADSPSTLSIASGASFTVSKSWENFADSAFQIHIEQGGTFHIGNGLAGTDATQLNGVEWLNKGTLHIHEQAALKADTITMSAQDNDTGYRAKLIIDGTLEANTIHLDGNSWHAIGTLEISNGDQVQISTLSTGSHGQVDVNVRSGQLQLDSILASANQPLVLNAEPDCAGIISIRDAVENNGSLHARAGRIEFNGGLNGSGTVHAKNNVDLAVTGSAANNTIALDQNATIELHGNFSGGNISGSGTVKKTDAGHATVSTNSDFYGSVIASGGHLTLVSGSSQYHEISATGGELTFLNVSTGMSIHTLQIHNESVVRILSDDHTESTVIISHTMAAGHGTLYADLVLENGAILDITDNRGLMMGSSITLSGKVTLGGTIISALVTENLESYTLSSSMDGFYTDGHDSSWSHGDSANASLYFTSDDLDLSQYTLSYVWENPDDSTSGLLRLTRNIPEPTACSLGVWGLSLLLLRRRRG